jgi:hypothetical protein
LSTSTSRIGWFAAFSRRRGRHRHIRVAAAPTEAAHGMDQPGGCAHAAPGTVSGQVIGIAGKCLDNCGGSAANGNQLCYPDVTRRSGNRHFHQHRQHPGYPYALGLQTETQLTGGPPSKSAAETSRSIESPSTGPTMAGSLRQNLKIARPDLSATLVSKGRYNDPSPQSGEGTGKAPSRRTLE